MTKITRDVTLAFIVAISMATFSSDSKAQTIYSDPDDLLSQKTRADIFHLIDQNEGMHFRKICRKLDKKMGVVQYHISVLEKHGYIKSIKDGRYKCFFSEKHTAQEQYRMQQLTSEQKELRQYLITSMKRKTPKTIITTLMDDGRVSHQELAELCDVSPQAITFHCQRLGELSLISSEKIGRQKYYQLSDAVQKIISYL